MYSSPAPDIYFHEGYGRAAAHSQDGLWASIELADGRWRLPYVERNLPSGRRDATSPYGYAGVFAAPGLSERDQRELWKETLSILDERSITTLFVRQSPLIPHPEPPDSAILVVRHHPIHYVAMQPSLAQIWDGMEGRCRTAIRKAVKSGVTVELRPARESDFESSSPFMHLYEATMRRVGAAPPYFFDETYYSLLMRGLRGDLYLGIVRKEIDEPLAAALFMRGPKVMHYHLSGSTREGARLGATNMLLWNVIELALELKLAGMLLGGGLKSDDGLDRFKRSFGGAALPFKAYGVVVNQESYNHEMTIEARRRGISINDLQRTSYFPPYRETMQEPSQSPAQSSGTESQDK